ncbi:hypothetical protein UlMin_000657 [Ulmus minor]
MVFGGGGGGGDFNVVRYCHEKSPPSRRTRSVRLFDELIRELELRDLALHNASFTWSNFREEVVKSRLDRFLFTEEWEAGKNDIRQETGSRTCSDHMPIILDTSPVSWGPSPFRFENMWLEHSGFRQECEQWWRGIEVEGWESYRMMEKLRALKDKIKTWNKEVFGDTRLIKNEVVEKIAGLDKKRRNVAVGCKGKGVEVKFEEPGGGISLQRGRWWDFDDINWGRIAQERACWLERPFEEEEIKKAKLDVQQVKDFRPISLVSGVYKILAKLLANRLREVLEETISMAQGAFVHNRQILDVVLVASEAVEDYRKRKKRGVIFKVDFEKAFGASRGLRQGDPLSPFLFILVADILGRMMDKAVSIGEVKGFKVGREEVVVSHLQFADDTLFLLDPDQSNIQKVHTILNFFSMCSGLKINMNKSSLAGIHMEDEEVMALAAVVGCEKGSSPMKYLGLPLGGNPNSTEFWNPVVEKVGKRLDGWKKSVLSKGGRLTMIQSVLSSIPIYFMSLFKLPNGVAALLEKMMR